MFRKCYRTATVRSCEKSVGNVGQTLSSANPGIIPFFSQLLSLRESVPAPILSRTLMRGATCPNI